MMPPVTPSEAERAEIARLRSPRTIRAAAERMLALAEEGVLDHFGLDLTRLPAVAERVARLMLARPEGPLALPYHSRWRHFSIGGVDRAAAFERRLAESGASERERLRARFDLVITSVLLDAGAGAEWSFREPETGIVSGRSEGLALASYHLFLSGGLSSDPKMPLRADPEGLEAMTEAVLARAFQVTQANPLVGLSGRVTLLRRLGAILREGHLADAVLARASSTVPASTVLDVVLQRLSPIWPGRQEIAGVNLGDVWPHPRVGLVPFHKLSQWLTYSLLEPLEAAGIRVVDLDDLTGLAEYRNGGLFVDAGVVVPRHDGVLARAHAVDSEVVVEWRALTVALLDRVAAFVRRLLGVDAQVLPLARVLEGGTWSAGREIARERRPDGRPPIAVESDGTVF
jgi:Protein of unknown function (DUF1688)